MEIKSIDHLVITVADIDKTVAFYSQILGMEVIKFGANRTALKFGNQKINIHHVENVIKPNAQNATPGSADLCFITETPVEEVMNFMQNNHIDIELGPVERTGAQGPIISIYVRDPDKNLIEVANYIN